MQAVAVVVHEPVAQQRQRVGDGEELGDGGQSGGHGADRKEATGQEPRQKRDGRGGADVLLLFLDAGSENLRQAMHERCQADDCRGGPQPARDVRGERRSASQGGTQQRDHLEQAHREGDGQVAEHHQRAGGGGGQQVTLSAAIAVHDHPDPAKDAAERNEQADRADGNEALVVDPRGRGDGLGECRRDHIGEQDRGEERDEDLAWGMGAEYEPAAGQGGEHRPPGRTSDSGVGRGSEVDGRCSDSRGHRVPWVTRRPRAGRLSG